MAATTASNTTYRLADDSFRTASGRWDSSGGDTLDAGGIAAGVVLRPEPGMRSEHRPGGAGLLLRRGRHQSHHLCPDTGDRRASVIENAVGTAHDDVIRGSSFNNRITTAATAWTP